MIAGWNVFEGETGRELRLTVLLTNPALRPPIAFGGPVLSGEPRKAWLNELDISGSARRSTAVDITMNRSNGNTVAIVVGEADADNCHQLGEALLRSDLQGPLHVNLYGLTFLDSSAVSELLRIHSVLADRGTGMVIADPSPAVHRVLEVTGLLDVFGIPSD